MDTGNTGIGLLYSFRDMPAITVIIVNLNGERYLSDCLNSLSAQTFTDFEVIVVDNGSSDNSLSLIKKDFPHVRIISLPENTGFAAGNNVGFRASSSKYIATLNNDTIACAGWLEALYNVAESDSQIGMVASKIILGREGNLIDSVGMLIYPDGMSRQCGHGERDIGQYDKVREVFFPSACAALYRSNMLENIGFFEEEFFSYCEDTDLGLRARLSGWTAFLAPKAVVRHLYSQTGGKYSAFKAYHVERNRFWVLLKNLPGSSIGLFPFYSLWRYMVVIYGILARKGSAARFVEGSGPLEMLRILLRAYCDGIAGVATMIKKRKENWRSRRISMKDYRILLKRYRIAARELMLRD